MYFVPKKGHAYILHLDLSKLSVTDAATIKLIIRKEKRNQVLMIAIQK